MAKEQENGIMQMTQEAKYERLRVSFLRETENKSRFSRYHMMTQHQALESNASLSSHSNGDQTPC